jgi:DNA polymerase-3 subunit alpha (Gram-positive type)
MNRNIKEAEFTIFDTETTGLEPESGDRIIEIAGIRFKGDNRISFFQTLINPFRAVSEGAFQVNRITQDMLVNAPKMEEIMPKFLDFIRGSCLCSYNAPFDLGFLNTEIKLLGQESPKDILVVDILTMARRLLSNLDSYALGFVAEKLGIKSEQKHRALADVELTLSVFNKLVGVLERKGIVDFNNFVSLFSINLHIMQDLNSRKIAKIQEAIDLGVRLKIKYFSCNGGGVSEREVIPKEIKQDKHSYLIGFCCLRNEERTFRIDSIMNLEII